MISKAEKEKVKKMLDSVFCKDLSSKKYLAIRESNARWGNKRNTLYHLVKGLAYVEDLKRSANRLFNGVFFEKRKVYVDVVRGLLQRYQEN